MKHLKPYHLFESKEIVTAGVENAIKNNNVTLFKDLQNQHGELIDYDKILDFLVHNLRYFSFAEHLPEEVKNQKIKNWSFGSDDKNNKNYYMSVSEIFNIINSDLKDGIPIMKNLINVKNDTKSSQFFSDDNYKNWKAYPITFKLQIIQSYITFEQSSDDEIPEEVFDNYYKPQINHIERVKPEHDGIEDGSITGWSGTLYETYGEDLEYVMLPENSKKVWTLLDDDDDNPYNIILAGFHRLNRQAYFITEKEWKTGNEEVQIEK